MYFCCLLLLYSFTSWITDNLHLLLLLLRFDCYSVQLFAIVIWYLITVYMGLLLNLSFLLLLLDYCLYGFAIQFSYLLLLFDIDYCLYGLATQFKFFATAKVIWIIATCYLLFSWYGFMHLHCWSDLLCCKGLICMKLLKYFSFELWTCVFIAWCSSTYGHVLFILGPEKEEDQSTTASVSTLYLFLLLVYYLSRSISITFKK